MGQSQSMWVSDMRLIEMTEMIVSKRVSNVDLCSGVQESAKFKLKFPAQPPRPIDPGPCAHNKKIAHVENSYYVHANLKTPSFWILELVLGLLQSPTLQAGGDHHTSGTTTFTRVAVVPESRSPHLAYWTGQRWRTSSRRTI